MTPGRISLAVVLAAGALMVGLAPAQEKKPAPAANPSGFEVEKHADIAYRTDAAADPERHKLDVYVPKGAKDYPVLFFVHGGSWKSGNKNLYVAIGQAFAKVGIGTVITNYRLSPQVKHPAHAEDVARAFAWTHANIDKYGGKADRIVVFGHSAGGHLVSLLATDPNYLKAEKLSPTDIHGVIAVSGVYQIYHDVAFFNPMFGTDADVCKKASPLAHVGGKHPPFLIAYADRDFDHLDRMAFDLNAALEKCKCPTTLLKLKDRTHITIITGVIDAADPLNKAVREFVMGK
ncbi:MAG: nlhH 1 [Gemmataceae bacterium]|nr:nlhH 1 [Gemmataceae bacterium]